MRKTPAYRLPPLSLLSAPSRRILGSPELRSPRNAIPQIDRTTAVLLPKSDLWREYSCFDHW